LRAIAGLESLDAGTISWDGADLSLIPIHRRGFALMFQDGQLFAHRSVFDNIAYPLRLQRKPLDAVTELLELVGLSGFERRSIRSMSGGEQQRVALARALAASPRLLLLDEPLSALDRELRERLATDLRGILTRTRTTAIFVTHDQSEAFVVADRVAIMTAGRVVQDGTPSEVWRAPATAEIARFLGYSSVLGVAGAELLGLDGPIALRRTALVVGADGTPCEVVGVVPGLDGDRLRVKIDGLPELDAIGDPAGTRVRVDVAAIARVP